MADNTQEIVVTDIKMPFVSLVVRLVKWSLAAIPAVVILISIGVAIPLVLAAVFGGMGGWHGRM